eukprot:TRINITY_DN4595_c0_g1_i18.p1 TRINITY_DN4595_c0_g1~~TRINITY_DN4595_c0_g1_i18.p1  ORF type:complete len:266 (-),score=44.20 TRINITY_DN4595_c0_g1_i18:93-890(-)
MELRRSFTQREEEDYSNLISKRLQHFNYINKVFTEPVLWLNSIKISFKDINQIQPVEVIQSLSLRCFILSLNLARFTDFDNSIESVNIILLLFEEYSQYYLKEKKLSLVQFRTNQPLLHLFDTNKSVLSASFVPQWKKNKEAQNTLVHEALTLPDNEPAISIPVEPTHSPAKAKELNNSRSSFSTLAIINAPIDLDFKAIVCQLCETLTKIYKKLENVKANELHMQIKKIDGELKRSVLYQLYEVINDTAIRLMKSGIEEIMTNA